MRPATLRIMGSEVLVQTRLPPDVAEWLAAEAEREGLSLAAWLRRLVYRERSVARVGAWVAGREDAWRRALEPPAGAPPFLLRRRWELSGTELVFTLCDWTDEEPLAPVLLEQVQDAEWLRRPETFRFVLRGSSRPWEIVRTLEVRPGGPLEIVLRLEAPAGGR